MDGGGGGGEKTDKHENVKIKKMQRRETKILSYVIIHAGAL